MTHEEENNANRSYRDKPLIAPTNGVMSNGHAAAPSQGATASGGGAGMDFSAIWEAMRRGKWIILLTAVFCTGAITAYTLTMEPTYEAESIVSVDTRPVVPASAAAMAAAPPMTSYSLSGEVGVLENSAMLAERIVRRLQENVQALGTDKHYPLLQGDTLSVGETARHLMERASFQALEEQNMIQITAESKTPEEAAAIANAYTKEYETFSQERARESIAASRKFLEEQVSKREAELAGLESRLKNFARERQMVDHGQAGDQVVEQYSRLQQQRDEAQFQMQQERLMLERLQEQLDQVEPGLSREFAQEQEVSEIRSEIDAANQQLATLKSEAETYYAVDPSRRNNETDITALEELKDRIAHFTERKQRLSNQLVDKAREVSDGNEGGAIEYVARLRGRMAEKRLNIDELQSQTNALNNRLGSYSGQLQAIPQQRIEQEQLERKIAQAEEWYNSFAAQLQKVRVAEEGEQGFVSVVRSALVPTAPVSPDLQQNVILGLLLGLGLGTGLAFMFRANRRQLERPDDVEAYGYELVGVIPTMNRQIKESFGGRSSVQVEGREMSTSLMTLLDPWSPVAENFRLIRTNIQFTQTDQPVRSLLVTSPEMSDGKSVASVNLAVAMAQDGRRTLLIDADLRRPAIHRLLGMDLAPGLAEIVQRQVPFEREHFTTPIENLSFIPAGQLDVPPTELLGSERMRNFIKTVRPLYDAIIVDSPPVLAATDAVVLATQCDATVVVVSAEKTNFQALEATQGTLRSVGAHVVGTIMNRFDSSKAGNGTGYGYYYDQEYTAEAR